MIRRLLGGAVLLAAIIGALQAWAELERALAELDLELDAAQYLALTERTP